MVQNDSNWQPLYKLIEQFFWPDYTSMHVIYYVIDFTKTIILHFFLPPIGLLWFETQIQHYV